MSDRLAIRRDGTARRRLAVLLDRLATPGNAVALLVLHVTAQALLRLAFGTGL